MIFLTQNDFMEHLGDDILSQITNDNSLLIEKCELQAIGVIKDTLSGMYDIDEELSEDVADDRHQPLVLWLLALACYYLYRQIPDDEVPARIIKDYDDTIETLNMIARGKKPTSMLPVQEDGVTKRVFRMSSQTARGHNML